MDPPHNLPPVSTGQPSQSEPQESLPSEKPVPVVQERPSSLVQSLVKEPSSVQPQVQERSASGGSSESSNPQHLSLATDSRKPLLEGSDGSPSRGRNEQNVGFESHIPVPPRNADMRRLSRRSVMSQRPVSTPGLDWIVPVDEKPRRRTIGERLDPTIVNAEGERTKYAIKAQWTSYALNIAIGLQVLFGALTTGLSAALSGRQVSIGTAILGGFSTIVASYLARARGSNEPELSITRVKDLDHFLRDCLAFKMDHGHEYGTPENGLDERLENFRRRFEELLGNADGQRKLSPPV